MKKTDHTGKAGSRALPPSATAALGQLCPGRDELDDLRESPWMCSQFEDETSDWPEVEKGAVYAGSGYSEQTDESLAPDVENEINLLVRGVSYR